jgi:hypothetical protein
VAYLGSGAHHGSQNEGGNEVQKMFCPQCGSEVGQVQPFCKFCGTRLASTTAESQPKRNRRRITRLTLWILGILFGLSVLLIIRSVPEQHAQPRTSHTEHSPPQNAAITDTPEKRTPESYGGVSEISELSTPLAFETKRIDPPKEASNAEIGKILVQTELISVSCGEHADMQTCKLFVTALSSALKKEHVRILLYHDPEEIWAGSDFFVEPRLLPSLYVTLRLVETGTPQSVQLHLGGFCFDPNGKDWDKGFQLPIWVANEGGHDYGPLEPEKAKAASKIASAFASYWISAVSLNREQPYTPELCRLGWAVVTKQLETPGSGRAEFGSLTPPVVAQWRSDMSTCANVDPPRSQAYLSVADILSRPLNAPKN